jgi:hypothetical protein
LAQIALDLGLAETLLDDRLRPIARLVEEHCDKRDYSTGLVLGLIEDEETRRLVSAWTFVEVPTPAEFREALRRFRARWLDRRLKDAHARGDDSAVDELQREKSDLLRQVARERSSRHEE